MRIYIYVHIQIRGSSLLARLWVVWTAVSHHHMYMCHIIIYRLKLACTLVKLCVSRPTLRAPAGRLPTYVARPLAYGTILILTEQY